MRAYKLNRQRFRFQAVRIRLSITIRFQFQQRKILCRRSRFWYKFDLFSIKVDHFRSIFDVLIKMIDQNDWLKDLKKLINYQPILISFWSILIDFDLFYTIPTWFNQFRHDDKFRFQEFGSKKLIKRRFVHDISRLVNLDWLDCLSLVLNHSNNVLSTSF